MKCSDIVGVSVWAWQMNCCWTFNFLGDCAFGGAISQFFELSPPSKRDALTFGTYTSPLSHKRPSSHAGPG